MITSYKHVFKSKNEHKNIKIIIKTNSCNQTCQEIYTWSASGTSYNGGTNVVSGESGSEFTVFNTKMTSCNSEWSVWSNQVPEFRTNIQLVRYGCDDGDELTNDDNSISPALQAVLDAYDNKFMALAEEAMSEVKASLGEKLADAEDRLSSAREDINNAIQDVKNTALELEDAKEQLAQATESTALIDTVYDKVIGSMATKAEFLDTVASAVTTATTEINASISEIKDNVKYLNVNAAYKNELITALSGVAGTILDQATYTKVNDGEEGKGEVRTVREVLDAMNASIDIVTDFIDTEALTKTNASIMLDAIGGSIKSDTEHIVDNQIIVAKEELSSVLGKIVHDVYKTTEGSDAITSIGQVMDLITNGTPKLTQTVSEMTGDGEVSFSQIRQTTNLLANLVEKSLNGLTLAAGITTIINEDNSSDVTLRADKIVLLGETLASKISAQTISLGAGSSVFNASGSGYLANHAISWNKNGYAEFNGNVRLYDKFNDNTTLITGKELPAKEDTITFDYYIPVWSKHDEYSMYKKYKIETVDEKKVYKEVDDIDKETGINKRYSAIPFVLNGRIMNVFSQGHTHDYTGTDSQYSFASGQTIDNIDNISITTDKDGKKKITFDKYEVMDPFISGNTMEKSLVYVGEQKWSTSNTVYYINGKTNEPNIDGNYYGYIDIGNFDSSTNTVKISIAHWHWARHGFWLSKDTEVKMTASQATDLNRTARITDKNNREVDTEGYVDTWPANYIDLKEGDIYISKWGNSAPDGDNAETPISQPIDRILNRGKQKHSTSDEIEEYTSFRKFHYVPISGNMTTRSYGEDWTLKVQRTEREVITKYYTLDEHSSIKKSTLGSMTRFYMPDDGNLFIEYGYADKGVEVYMNVTKYKTCKFSKNEIDYSGETFTLSNFENIRKAKYTEDGYVSGVTFVTSGCDDKNYTDFTKYKVPPQEFTSYFGKYGLGLEKGYYEITFDYGVDWKKTDMYNEYIYYTQIFKTPSAFTFDISEDNVTKLFFEEELVPYTKYQKISDLTVSSKYRIGAMKDNTPYYLNVNKPKTAPNATSNQNEATLFTISGITLEEGGVTTIKLVTENNEYLQLPLALSSTETKLSISDGFKLSKANDKGSSSFGIVVSGGTNNYKKELSDLFVHLDFCPNIYIAQKEPFNVIGSNGIRIGVDDCSYFEASSDTSKHITNLILANEHERTNISYGHAGTGNAICCYEIPKYGEVTLSARAINIDGELYAPQFIGTIVMWSGYINRIPQGWWPCMGQKFDIREFPMLAYTQGHGGNNWTTHTPKEGQDNLTFRQWMDKNLRGYDLWKNNRAKWRAQWKWDDKETGYSCGCIPNLQGKFIVGASYDALNNYGYDYGWSAAPETNYKVHDTGGENYHQLNVKEMPSHYHLYYGDDQIANIGGITDAVVNGYDADSELEGGGTRYRTSDSGGNIGHENRPPYYALIYLIKMC